MDYKAQLEFKANVVRENIRRIGGIEGLKVHEFKTPIASINGFAKLLLEESVSEEDKQQYLQIIASESERLASLADSSLLLSKLESQQFIMDKKPYSLDEQIKHCAILLSKEWNKKGIELTAELEQVQYNGSYDLMNRSTAGIVFCRTDATPPA